VPLGESSLPIVAFDFEMEGNLIHIVWLDGRSQLFYSRKENGQASWTRPALIGKGGKPCLKLAPDGLHLITASGYSLSHFEKERDADSWRQLPPITDANELIQGFDAVIAGRELLVAYLLPRNQTRLRVVRWSGSSLTAPVTVTAAEASGLECTVKLAATERELHVLWSQGSWVQHTKKAISSRAELFYSRTTNGGVAWTPPVNVSMFANRGASSLGTGKGTQLITPDSIELVVSGTELFAFYRDGIPLMTTSTDGQVWRPAVSLSPYPAGWIKGKSITATFQRDCVRVCWIDNRFEQRDKRLNPLGGFPWSDANPAWGNNDVLTYCIAPAELREFSRGRVEPLRVTQPLSYTRSIQSKKAGDHVYLFWLGVRAVRKSATGSNVQNSEIFFQFFN